MAIPSPFHGSPFAYDAAGKDYLIWQVVNPSTWLMPILISLVVLALAVHSVAFAIPGRAWTNQKLVKAPVAVAAPAAAKPAAK